MHVKEGFGKVMSFLCSLYHEAAFLVGNEVGGREVWESLMPHQVASGKTLIREAAHY